ncbi:Cysteinyl-tRNA synthetase [Labilithrix luteola]|uniref:Cysteine--tRNA ligase n=1 Tax=Labilithrix luteola TaxID=1391654 RepID=A0A0K1PYP3_9BACT|nr:cysteine--tRNA ligase [Labilithrix luteola]AKU98254.1 Cysteinyl-tRNA synthetase [Labilithrix luteola]
MTRSLVLYDNFTRSLRPFEPLRPDGEVGLYTCGPTVYDDQHIGNYRTFLFEDILKRVLRWNGHRVKHVMNVTDVGHLVGDGDDGEDKLVKGARRAGRSAWEIADHFTRAFVRDLELLRIEKADILCRATDHIAEQIAFIVALEARGFTYRTSDGIYFDTSKLPSYGELARLDTAGLDAGRRVAMGDKHAATDFALWKFSPEAGARREMEWESPWGIGFPGWHIECSAMAQKYLGDFFDIHCGGEDHIPVHHTNEIAQTEARVGTRLANFWLHGYFLVHAPEDPHDETRKMSKSTEDFLRVALLVERGYDLHAYRYFCFTGHYRTQLSFSWQALDAAKAAFVRLQSGFASLEHDRATPPDASSMDGFESAINADLNMPRALAVAWDVLRGSLPSAVKRATLARFDDVLGFDLSSPVSCIEETVPPPIRALADERLHARSRGDYAQADALRTKLREAGWTMEDRPGGYRLRRC